MVSIDQLADEDRVSAELVAVRGAANEIRLRIDEDRHSADFSPVPNRETIFPARAFEHFGNLAVAESKNVYTKGVGARQRLVKRCGPIDTNEQRRRLKWYHGSVQRPDRRRTRHG